GGGGGGGPVGGGYAFPGGGFHPDGAVVGQGEKNLGVVVVARAGVVPPVAARRDLDHGRGGGVGLGRDIAVGSALGRAVFRARAGIAVAGSAAGRVGRGLGKCATKGVDKVHDPLGNVRRQGRRGGRINFLARPIRGCLLGHLDGSRGDGGANAVVDGVGEGVGAGEAGGGGVGEGAVGVQRQRPVGRVGVADHCQG